MAWTTPRTWVTGEVVTASLLNTHLRDNLLETAPGKATDAGRIIVTTGANAITDRQVSYDGINTQETTTSTSYVNLTTTGPDFTTGTSGIILIGVSCRASNNTADAACFMDFAVTGDSSRSASDTTALMVTSRGGGNQYRASSVQILDAGIVAGTNTFTAKYRVDAGTGTFNNRRIWGVPF